MLGVLGWVPDPCWRLAVLNNTSRLITPVPGVTAAPSSAKQVLNFELDVEEVGLPAANKTKHIKDYLVCSP